MSSHDCTKECQRCHQRKHITKFRKSGKVRQSCNDCNDPNRTKFCQKCLTKKKVQSFQRNSRTYPYCNACASSIDDIIEDGFLIANSFFNEKMVKN